MVITLNLSLSCSASQCVPHLSGRSGLPAVRLAVEGGDIERPSMSLSASHLTFALSIGSRRASVKHLASLILINMAVQVSQLLR